MTALRNQNKKKPDCNDYIKCEMIINIFKSNNTDEQMSVFKCLRNNYFNLFKKAVVFQQDNIKTEYLEIMARDEFEESLHSFLINIKNDSYKKKADCITYLKSIFKNKYFKALESKKRKLVNEQSIPFEFSENGFVHHSKSEQVQIILNEISLSYKNYINWFYFDGLSIKQISAIPAILHLQ